jgi:hypothetical protein
VAATEPTIERKGYTDQRARTVMLAALRGRGATLTRADAIAASGLPEDEAGRALTVLLKEYRSHLSATATGELLYQFDPKFERRDAVSLRERAAAVGDKLWRAFSFLFKIAIVATLVGYFTLFVAMMVAMIFARSSSSDRDDDGGGFGIGPLFWFWGWDPTPTGYGRPARAVRTAPRAPFYKRVFAFVFGPPPAKVDPLEDEKRIVAHIRGQRGRIAPVDLVRLMGWTFPRAEEEATRLMVDYGGEPEVTDDGVVVYAFKSLRLTAGGGGSTDALAPRWASERLEPTPPLTGNEPGTNTLIGVFNGFNLLAPFWIVPAFEARLHVSLASWQFLFVDFPIAFSALFFAVPFGRWIKARIDARARADRNDRRRLLGRIFAGGAHAGPRLREELAPTPALGALLDRELVSLGGDIAAEPDAQGRVRYTFPRIEQETAALARARAAAPATERDAGAIVFSSAD